MANDTISIYAACVWIVIIPVTLGLGLVIVMAREVIDAVKEEGHE